MKKLVLLLALLALAAFGLGACGGDDDDDEAATTEPATATTTEAGGGGGGGGEGGSISLAADSGGELAYDTDSASVPAGEVTIEFDNPASLEHDVVVEDADGNELARTDVISGGSTSTSAELEAGEYTFYCSVDGHRAAGMEGTLTVE